MDLPLMFRYAGRWARGAVVGWLVSSLAGGAWADANLPEPAENRAVTYVTAQEKQLGAAWLRQLRGQVSTLDDPWLTEYLLDLVYRLYPASGMQDGHISLVVVDSAELNAFAVPGGVIGVNGGLLLYTRKEDELASVLAHELAHLAQRHFARRQEEAGKSAALNLAGMLASVVIAAAAGSDAGLAAMAATQGYSAQSQLAYSRDNESEADRLGMRILASSGFSPQAMPDMFRRMAEANRYSTRAPEYLLTHPLSETRLADAQSRARQYPETPRSSGLEYAFVQARMQVHYAERPSVALDTWRSRLEKQGAAAVDARVDVWRYAAALAALRAGELSQAGAWLKGLMASRPDSAMVQELYARWLVATGKPEAALSTLRRALELRPGRYALMRAYADAAAAAGEWATAINVLRELARDHEEEPAIWLQLADLYGKSGALAQVHMARAEADQLRGNLEGAIRELMEARKKAAGDYIAATRIAERLKLFQEWKRNPPF